MVRMALEGRLLQDFYWKVQIQANGNTSDLGSSPRMVDAFAEWQKYDAFKIKAGQFKRPFSFENPMHPITQGFMGYSQNITKLSGFSDRVGEHASNGRDVGVQIQGDFLKNNAGRNLVHYQVGVFNGQGTNQKDVDQRKDIIGGAWVMPIKGLRIGARMPARIHGLRFTTMAIHMTRVVCALYQKTDMPLVPNMLQTTGQYALNIYIARVMVSSNQCQVARRPTAT